MDNQHKQIPGYRDFDQATLDAVVDLKNLGIQIAEKLDALAQNPAVDQDWLAAGRHDMSVGLMQVIRSVAKPKGL